MKYFINLSHDISTKRILFWSEKEAEASKKLSVLHGGLRPQGYEKRTLSRDSISSLSKVIKSHYKLSYGKLAQIDDYGLPLISVITVVFNSENLIRKTIESVLKQTYENVEYIVIDGGSTDRTIDIVKEYSDSIDYWISEPDKGIYDAMNKGINYGNGSAFLMLHSGDFMKPNMLSTMVGAIDNVEDKIVYSNYFVHFEDDRIPQPRYSYLDLASKGMRIMHQAMLIGKKMHETFGLYSLDYKFASDYDFTLQIVKNSKSHFVYVPDHLVYYLYAGTSMTNYSGVFKELIKISGKYSTATERLCLILRVSVACVLRFIDKIINSFRFTKKQWYTAAWLYSINRKI